MSNQNAMKLIKPTATKIGRLTFSASVFTENTPSRKMEAIKEREKRTIIENAITVNGGSS